ncbi:AAA family ATPase [uncultured Brevundimonas sp.]|uniref:AAA family ATPase n=1 Tax=uncultured Brevundimonas sp. TaxID=213418 RepID=UPI0025F66B48|nr:AAA family ATPase [uncultured Brevundimonas sp.]
MRIITRVSVENFLSLRRLDVRLDELNVLVGPNGAGKTNVLKVFEFLGEVARNELVPAIQGLGGFQNVLFRGSGRPSRTVKIEVSGIITKHSSLNAQDEYKLSFSKVSGLNPPSRRHDYFRRREQLVFKRYQGPGRRITLSGSKVSVGTDSPTQKSAERTLEIMGDATGLGTLRRLSDAYGASEWNAFAEVVERLRLFEVNVEQVRTPGIAEDRPILKADASNLAAFLKWLREFEPTAYRDICNDVRFVLPGFEGFEFKAIGGAEEAVELFIRESNLEGDTPLARASFGTIRAIALFAMLHDPNPPKLTCLEEIDHGLHPHALDRVVERLRQASSRTQIILATHSPALVNRLKPSELIIVERDEETGGSRAERPDEGLVARLKKNTGYELGELWFSGVLGGDL